MGVEDNPQFLPEMQMEQEVKYKKKAEEKESRFIEFAKREDRSAAKVESRKDIVAKEKVQEEEKTRSEQEMTQSQSMRWG